MIHYLPLILSLSHLKCTREMDLVAGRHEIDLKLFREPPLVWKKTHKIMWSVSNCESENRHCHILCEKLNIRIWTLWNLSCHKFSSAISSFWLNVRSAKSYSKSLIDGKLGREWCQKFCIYAGLPPERFFTYRGRDKMSDICRWHFQMHFLIKIYEFWLTSHWR